MHLNEPLVMELNREATTTRRLLDRLPEPEFAWKPHEKSMTLSRLAVHLAEIPGWVSHIMEQEEFDVGTSGYVPPVVGSVAEVLAMFDTNVAAAVEALRRQTDERLLAPWRLKKKGQVIVEMPRIGMIRSFLLSHFIHHRGQLSVYLRLRNVPVPSIYGPSADEPM